jgi:A/G-specific adenine glycosylase
MLQRTRAKQVAPVYLEFIGRFPEANSLNNIRTAEIRRFISKLGLTWRTETIVRTAHELNSKYNGMIPRSKNKLLMLPGIGEYISDALMVFGYKRRLTVIDVNVIRLVCRFFGIPLKGEIRRKKEFIRFCQTLVEKIPSDQIRNFNWALIDFPAVICLKNPRCSICPLSKRCDYFSKNLKTSRGN